MVKEWDHAINGTWVPEGSIEKIQDKAQKYLVGKYKLAYIAGKGRRHVPVLIPLDLIEPVKLLNSNRKSFGIPECNTFLFATKSSNAHCSGWHDVAAVCNAAQVYGKHFESLLSSI